MRIQQLYEATYSPTFSYMNDFGKGFSKYDEMVENNLFIEKSGAKRWHERKNLMTTIYLYDGIKMIGWAALNYGSNNLRDAKMYGNVLLGTMSAFVDPSYRSKGLARQLLKQVKVNIDLKKTPIGKTLTKMDKTYNRVKVTIKYQDRLEKHVKDVFNDMNIWDEPQYEYKQL